MGNTPSGTTPDQIGANPQNTSNGQVGNSKGDSTSPRSLNKIVKDTILSSTNVVELKIAIRGSVGSGKSSLLHCLQGESIPTTHIPSEAIATHKMVWKTDLTDEQVILDIADIVDNGVPQRIPRAKIPRGMKLPDDYKLVKNEYVLPPTDATTVDVYKGVHCLIVTIDPFIQDSYNYAVNLLQNVPKDTNFTVIICVMKRDLPQADRQVTERMLDLLCGSIIPRIDISLITMYGLAELYKYIEIPYLRLKHQQTLAQARLLEQRLHQAEKEFQTDHIQPEYETYLQMSQSNTPSILQQIHQGNNEPDDPFALPLTQQHPSAGMMNSTMTGGDSLGKSSGPTISGIDESFFDDDDSFGGGASRKPGGNKNRGVLSSGDRFQDLSSSSSTTTAKGRHTAGDEDDDDNNSMLTRREKLAQRKKATSAATNANKLKFSYHDDDDNANSPAAQGAFGDMFYDDDADGSGDPLGSQRTTKGKKKAVKSTKKKSKITDDDDDNDDDGNQLKTKTKTTKKGKSSKTAKQVSQSETNDELDELDFFASPSPVVPAKTKKARAAATTTTAATSTATAATTTATAAHSKPTITSSSGFFDDVSDHPETIDVSPRIPLQTTASSLEAFEFDEEAELAFFDDDQDGGLDDENDDDNDDETTHHDHDQQISDDVNDDDIITKHNDHDHDYGEDMTVSTAIVTTVGESPSHHDEGSTPRGEDETQDHHETDNDDDLIQTNESPSLDLPIEEVEAPAAADAAADALVQGEEPESDEGENEEVIEVSEEVSEEVIETYHDAESENEHEEAADVTLDQASEDAAEDANDKEEQPETTLDITDTENALDVAADDSTIIENDGAVQQDSDLIQMVQMTSEAPIPAAFNDFIDGNNDHDNDDKNNNNSTPTQPTTTATAAISIPSFEFDDDDDGIANQTVKKTKKVKTAKKSASKRASARQKELDLLEEQLKREEVENQQSSVAIDFKFQSDTSGFYD